MTPAMAVQHDVKRVQHPKVVRMTDTEMVAYAYRAYHYYVRVNGYIRQHPSENCPLLDAQGEETDCASARYAKLYNIRGTLFLHDLLALHAVDNINGSAV
jgi:hypothetical protein